MPSNGSRTARQASRAPPRNAVKPPRSAPSRLPALKGAATLKGQHAAAGTMQKCPSLTNYYCPIITAGGTAVALAHRHQTISVQHPPPQPPVSSSKVLKPSRVLSILTPTASVDHEKENASAQAACSKPTHGGVVLSPLKMDLPDSPTLHMLWQKSSAAYERLRLQRLCKKVLHSRRREEAGLHDAITESPIPRLRVGHGVELSVSKALGLA